MEPKESNQPSPWAVKAWEEAKETVILTGHALKSHLPVRKQLY
ncbi:hypothetical protein [Paenibacillus uliginis]|nr:hypothetical protein [Paenibacillus uliginis]